MSDETHRGMAVNLNGKPDVWVPEAVTDALDIEIGDGVIFEVREDSVEMRLGEKNEHLHPDSPDTAE